MTDAQTWKAMYMDIRAHRDLLIEQTKEYRQTISEKIDQLEAANQTVAEKDAEIEELRDEVRHLQRELNLR